MQGGPGCASTFGMMYELGPCSVVDGDDGPILSKNEGSWGEHAGALRSRARRAVPSDLNTRS